MVPVGYEIDVKDPIHMFSTNELQEHEIKKYLIIGD